LNIIALVHLELKALNILQDKGTENEENDEKKKHFFRQYSDKVIDVDPLQRKVSEILLSFVLPPLLCYANSCSVRTN